MNVDFDNITYEKEIDFTDGGVSLAESQIHARFEKLMKDQPQLQYVTPYNFKTTVLTGLAFGMLGVLIQLDNLNYSEIVQIDRVEAILIFLIWGFLTGAIVDFLGRNIQLKNQSVARVNNLQMLSEWYKPIYIFSIGDSLEIGRFNFWKSKEIEHFLNDDKCTNTIHKALLDSATKFKYTVGFGSELGKTYEYHVGLPIICLHDWDFLLRGIQDEKDALEIKKEMLNCAYQIDSQFMCVWRKNSILTYHKVVGHQEMSIEETKIINEEELV